MALTEEHSAFNQIEVLEDGTIQVREAYQIYRDGEPDPDIPKRYHRYVLKPGDDLSERHPRIVAIANAVWSDAVVTAYANKIAAIEKASQ